MLNQRSPEEIAWVAGLFEGEGTIGVYGRPNRRGSGIHVAVGMADHDIVRRLRDLVGIGGLSLRPPGTNGHRPILVWSANRSTLVVPFLETILPWLGERRGAKARDAISHGKLICPKGERMVCPKGHPYTADNLMVEFYTRTGKDGVERTFESRRCRICRTEQSRERARKRLGITPDRYRIPDTQEAANGALKQRSTREDPHG